MPTQADMLWSGIVLQFDREQAPERIVHARGMTAFGTFEVTHDISNLTSAAFLNGVGTKVCEKRACSLAAVSAGAHGSRAADSEFWNPLTAADYNYMMA